MKQNLSTHVLDSSVGKPAENIAVTLTASSGEILAKGSTNSDGRVMQWEGSTHLQPGRYLLNFDVERYFKAQQVAAFYPDVTIHFEITDASEHYHVPLLLSPFSYSTYRGS